MVDYFALVLSHSLLAYAAWRLLLRGDLDGDPVRPDDEPAAPPPAAPAAGPRLTARPAPNPGLRTRA